MTQNRDWVIVDGELFHKEELRRWPAETIDPELWKSIGLEHPEWTIEEKDRCFWTIYEFRKFCDRNNIS